MAYAINGYKGIHSLKYKQAVAKKLEAAVTKGRGNFERIQKNIKNASREMKETLEDGGAFW